MLITNALIFAGTLLIILFLSCFNRRFFKAIRKKNCDFRISKTRFREHDQKRYAKFTISLKDKNQFFIDFPLAFRFYSNTRFKAKVKITYEALRSGRNPEQLVDKIIEFETRTVECKKRINDIIVGEIEIEIELNPYYGNPIVEFEILENNLCILKRPYKKIIKFPKKRS